MGEKTVLFIHGFMGSVAQFDFLGGAVSAAGWRSEHLTLPGHGGSLREFTRAHERDWQRAADQALDTLRGRCEKIVVVGHSMGGLLAINSYIKNPDKIERIVALALPLYIKLTLSGASVRFKALLAPREGEDCRVAAARECCSVSGITPLNSIKLLRNSIALLRLARNTREALKNTRVPLTLINSAADEIVSAKSSEFVAQAQPESERVALAQSGHFWYSDCEKAAVAHKLELILRQA